MKIKNVKRNGKWFPVVTIGGLAELCGRSVSAIYKLEERGIIRPANFRDVKPLKANGDFLPGARLYSLEFAKRMAEILKGVKQGVKITGEQKRQLALASQKEQLFVNGKL